MVQADFNAPEAVLHYTRAAHNLGLWKSERILIEKHIPDKKARILEAGCGAGRVTIGLWQLGYRNITGFDFAEELIEQAQSLAREKKADSISFLIADATRLSELPGFAMKAPFDAALFPFNGLMQIPGRKNRRIALEHLHRQTRPGGTLIFTTHDRDSSKTERALWRLESARWERGEQDKRLVEFGDRYFEDESGRTFMHLPNRMEIIEDLEATGWKLAFDQMRREIASESKAVLDFSDQCRFWVANRPHPSR